MLENIPLCSEKYEIPNKKICISKSNETYASIFIQYYESVISDTKVQTGALFRHFLKKSGMYTKTPFGINAMFLVRKEIIQNTKI